MWWFYHEYLDEERRMRIHRVEAETEKEARKLHRQACEFRWVTQHLEPSVSSLMTVGEYGPRSVVAGHRPGQDYSTVPHPVPMPDYVRDMLTGLRIGDEAAVSGVRPSDGGDEVHAAPVPSRRAEEPREEPAGFDTPF